MSLNPSRHRCCSSSGALLGLLSRIACVVLCFWFLCSPAYAAGPDNAETRSAARDLAQQGGRLYDQGRCKEAIGLFDRAYQLVRAPTIELLKARCLVKLGRFVDAVDAYERVRHTRLRPTDSEQYVQAVRAATTEVEALRPRVPRLTITVQGPGSRGAHVTMDGRALPDALIGVSHPVDPGTHRLAASAPGVGTAAQTVSVTEGRSYVVALHLQRAAPSGGQTVRALGWAGVGIGVAGLATGVATALMAGQRKAALDNECNRNACPPSAQHDLDQYRLLRTTSIAGYSVGVVGISVSAVLVLSAPKRSSGSLSAYLGAASAGLEGTF